MRLYPLAYLKFKKQHKSARYDFNFDSHSFPH